MYPTVAWPVEISGREYSVLFDGRDTNIAPAVAQDRKWESWQLTIYERLIRPDWCCLDIGANVGLNTIAMAQFAHAGRVFAFEPVLATLELLERNLENNLIDRKCVTVVPQAVGRARTTKEIAYSPEELGRASLCFQAEVSQGPALLREMVDVVPLDQWWLTYQRPTVNFIKIDVEGYELDVLAGASALLKEHPGLLLVCEMNLDASSQKIELDRDARMLFERLQQIFRHVLFVGRAGRLFPLNSYAQLRAYMMQGHRVDDLFCCNDVPSQLADLVSSQWVLPARLTQECEVDHHRIIVYSNRYADGWTSAIQGTYAGTSCAIAVSLLRDELVTVSLKPIHSAHAGLSSKITRVFIDESAFQFDLLDHPERFSLSLSAGLHWIFCETGFSLEARYYLGNDADPRWVGANLTLTFDITP
jgi:FkbM family methyltransferase